MAQIDHNPSNISEKTDGYLWIDEGQQGLYNTKLNHTISQMWAVSNYVSKSPDSLLAYVLMGRMQQFGEEGHSSSSDYGLGLLTSSTCNIG